MDYQFTLTENPSFAIFSNDEQFVHIECRVGNISEFEKKGVLEHIKFLDILKKEKELKGYLQLRRFFYDNKNSVIYCVVDYLTDNSDEEKLALSGDKWIIDGVNTVFDLKIVISSFNSDNFSPNHRSFYETERVIPWISDFNQYLFTRYLEDMNKKNKKSMT